MAYTWKYRVDFGKISAGVFIRIRIFGASTTPPAVRSIPHTVTTLGVEDGLTKKAAIESSRHKYAVMEREKFYFNESYKFTQLDELDGIITDEFPDQSVQDMLDSLGVTLY